MTATMWHDWTTGTGFAIRIHPSARDRLVLLPAATQLRIRSVLHELAELAELVPFSTEGAWKARQRPTLQVRVHDVTVQYNVSETSRAITVEAVAADDESSGFDRIA